MSTMSTIVDDKSGHCVPFLLEFLSCRQKKHGQEKSPPFFLGLNGMQGAGKTTLVSILHQTLASPPYNLPNVVVSLDDFYLRRDDQVELANSHPDNPLVQHRGQPSTHDLSLLMSTLESLEKRELTKLPGYDKSAFSGAGDRTDCSKWEEVNKHGEPTIEAVILEGWCVGFRPLSDEELKQKWAEAKYREEEDKGHGQLGKLKLEDVKFVNEALKQYDRVTDMFDAFIHIDAEDPKWVYTWRLEAEVKLRIEKGSGMTDEQVKRFVDGYYPAYELYTETLRRGIFKHKGRQLRLVIGQDRKVKKVQLI